MVATSKVTVATAWTVEELAEAKRLLLREAGDAVRAMPQYEGVFTGDAWALGLVQQTIDTKAGLAALRGELVLVPRGKVLGLRWVFWSSRNAMLTAYLPGQVSLCLGRSRGVRSLRGTPPEARRSP